MSGFPVPELDLTPPAPEVFTGTQLSPSPYHFRFTGEDYLEIATYNAVAGLRIAIHGRTLRDDGRIHPFTHQHVPNTDRSRSIEVFNLTSGWLLNVAVFAIVGSPRVAQTFVSLHVIRGRDQARVLLATLLQGYVTAEQELAYPGSPIVSSVDAGGYIRWITGTDPAAGAEISETVPTGARWQLLSWQSSLATTITAGNRTPQLRFAEGSDDFFSSVATLTIGPSTGAAYYWTVGAWLTSIVSGIGALAGIPTELPILAGQRIRTATSGLAAGDNWGAPLYVVREWLEAQ